MYIKQSQRIQKHVIIHLVYRPIKTLGQLCNYANIICKQSIYTSH